MKTPEKAQQHVALYSTFWSGMLTGAGVMADYVGSPSAHKFILSSFIAAAIGIVAEMRRLQNRNDTHATIDLLKLNDYENTATQIKNGLMSTRKLLEINI